MKRALLIFTVIAAIPLYGQHDEAVVDGHATAWSMNPFLATTPNNVDAVSFDIFLEKLSKKKRTFKSKSDFIQYAFERSRYVFLKRYAPHANFADLLQDGVYNCLTGTILYSLILNHYGIEHEVIETNYHIFILAYADDERILIEATDPQNGFVTDSKIIDERIELYKSNTLMISDDKLAHYRYSFNLYNTVTLDELRGLLYYNMAVDSFNQNLLSESITNLNKAINLYASPRIEEFACILLLAVQQSKSEEKVEWARTLQTIRFRAMPAMAGLEP